MCHRRRTRHLIALGAVLAWAGAVAVIAASHTWGVDGHRLLYQHALSVVLSVAITLTLAVLVDRMQTPIQTAYRLGWDAGWAEGHRKARPVLIPERRLQERRGERARN